MKKCSRRVFLTNESRAYVAKKMILNLNLDSPTHATRHEMETVLELHAICFRSKLESSFGLG